MWSRSVAWDSRADPPRRRHTLWKFTRFEPQAGWTWSYPVFTDSSDRGRAAAEDRLLPSGSNEANRGARDRAGVRYAHDGARDLSIWRLKMRSKDQNMNTIGF